MRRTIRAIVGGKRVPIEKLPRLPKQAATSVHRVKVSLYGARPPVWRRIEIPSGVLAFRPLAVRPDRQSRTLVSANRTVVRLVTA
jgi:hypothetical protein